MSQDIIVGIGGGKFAPAGKVTGSQLAKMLLVALGYSPDHQKYAGSAWEVNVNTDASARGFYEDLEDIDPSAPLTREHAAEMIWNALNANEVEYQNQLVTDENGQLSSKAVVKDRTDIDNNKITLLEDKYNTFNDYGLLTEYHWNTADKDYDYSISDYRYSADTSLHRNAYKYSSTSDYGDLFGMYVKVVATYDKKTSSVKVFGIVPDDSKVVASGIVDDLEYSASKEIKIDGTKYKTDGNATALQAVAFNDFSSKDKVFDQDNKVTLAGYFEMYAIDEDGNDKVDLIVYKPVYPAEIKSVGTKSIGLSYLNNALTANDAINMVIEDNDIYDGYAKNDYVVVVDQKNNPMDEYSVTKMDTFTGKVTAIQGTSKVQVDGSWYNNVTSGTSFRQDGNYEYGNIGSFVCYADQKGAASLTDVLYLDAIQKDNLSTRAKVYFYDGNSNTITISDIYQADGETPVRVNNSSNDVKGLYTYSEKNGEYELTKVASPDNLLGYKYTIPSGITKASDNVAGKMTSANGTYIINDDAVVFLSYMKDGAPKVKVVSGAVAKNYNAAVTGSGEALYDTANGNDKVVVAWINITGDEPNAKGVSGNYAYVTGNTFTTKIDGTKVVGYPVWDGKEELTIYDEASSVASGVSKGSLITFDNLGEGNVDNVKVAENAPYTLTFASVKGVDGDTFTTYGSSDTYIITKDTTILYINSADKEGQDNGSLQEAATTGTGTVTPTKNIAFVVDEADGTSTNAWKLDLLVIDVENDISGVNGFH